MNTWWRIGTLSIVNSDYSIELKLPNAIYSQRVSIQYEAQSADGGDTTAERDGDGMARWQF